jgi:hypothetical protein
VLLLWPSRCNGIHAQQTGFIVDIHCVYILISKEEKRRKCFGSLINLNVKVIFLKGGFLFHEKIIGTESDKASADGVDRFEEYQNVRG